VRHENVGAAHGAQIMRSVTSAISDRDGSHSLSTHLVTNKNFLSLQVLMVDDLLGFYTILHVSCSGDSEACAAIIFRVTKFGSGGCCSYPEDEGSTFLQNIGTNPLYDTV
jgi:hypothetical protein